MTHLTQVVRDQFDAAWSLLADTIVAFDDASWRRAGPGDLVPARLIVHILETADYYTHPDLGSYKWGARFGIDWEAAQTGELPDKRDLIAYLDDVRRKVAGWTGHLGDDGLLAPDEDFQDEGMCALDRGLYVLRHTHHHVGELFALLKEWNLPRPGWR